MQVCPLIIIMMIMPPFIVPDTNRYHRKDCLLTKRSPLSTCSKEGPHENPQHFSLSQSIPTPTQGDIPSIPVEGKERAIEGLA